MAGRMTNHFQYTETGKKSKGGFAKKTTSGTSFFVQKSKIVEFRYKKVKPADKPDCRPRPAERFCSGKRTLAVQHCKKTFEIFARIRYNGDTACGVSA